MLPSLNKARNAALASIMSTVEACGLPPDTEQQIRTVVRTELDRLVSRAQGILDAHAWDQPEEDGDFPHRAPGAVTSGAGVPYRRGGA
ncbi:MAG: hypothetical protein ACUVS5_11535 [Anaerolineae bacterium]